MEDPEDTFVAGCRAAMDIVCTHPRLKEVLGEPITPRAWYASHTLGPRAQSFKSVGGVRLAVDILRVHHARRWNASVIKSEDGQSVKAFLTVDGNKASSDIHFRVHRPRYRTNQLIAFSMY